MHILQTCRSLRCATDWIMGQKHKYFNQKLSFRSKVLTNKRHMLYYILLIFNGAGINWKFFDCAYPFYFLLKRNKISLVHIFQEKIPPPKFCLMRDIKSVIYLYLQSGGSLSIMNLDQSLLIETTLVNNSFLLQ